MTYIINFATTNTLTHNQYQFNFLVFLLSKEHFSDPKGEFVPL